ncbi:MAG TPA: adenylyltransferase/cytidyltransferase family protein [Bryobacteraceae bacterium]|nr:adenylyltransferase/cytidyltransferase family protein [Bryobacteraceae bacterium]
MSRRIGIVAGAFNPLTLAHTGLADAARAHVDEIVFAIPRAFPHKEFHGASLDHRLEMLRAAGCSPRITEGGLYLEIARQIRDAEPASQVCLICGSDAAERIVNWNYASPDALSRLFEEFQLLVADRQGTYQPPAAFRHRIKSLALPAPLADISSSEVRRRIAAREPWEHLVPESIVEFVRRIYSDRSLL